MTSIAPINTAPLVLQNTADSLGNLNKWFHTWIGWGLHRQQDWALSRLPSLYA
jgi:hypothetical protein